MENKSGPWATGGGTAEIGKDEKVLLEIRQHPLMRNVAVSVAVVVFILFIGLLSYVFMGNWFMPFLVYIFFFIALIGFFMPTRYMFTEEKLIVDRIISRNGYSWSRFRSFRAEKNGIYLSPMTDPDRFDRFRGVFVILDREGREKALPVVEELVIGAEGEGSADSSAGGESGGTGNVGSGHSSH